MIFTESVHTATSLASQGEICSAVEVLGDLWPGVGLEPSRNGESDLEYAELVLVCGILTMEIGRFNLLPSQASAKDLLSKAVRLFGDDPGRHVALYWLGWAYIFCGENHEALSLADTILTEQLADSDVVFRSGRLKALACLNLGNLAQAEAAFASVEVFLETVSPLARGQFYLNRGMLFRQMGRFEESLADHQSAIADFRVAGSRRLQASAVNNIAVVYTEQGRFAEAREAALEALSAFVELEDRVHEAKVWDQIAQIYGREQNYAEMARCADRAVEILSGSDHEGWLAEALITQGIARAQLGMAQAHQALCHALEICDRQGDSKQASAVTKAMWKIVCRGNDARSSMRDNLAPLERTVYERVLENHNGRVSPAAHELGLYHNFLMRRIANRFPELLGKRARPRFRRCFKNEVRPS